MKSLLQLFLSLSLLISFEFACGQTGTSKTAATGNIGGAVATFSGTFPEGNKGVPFTADIVNETDQVFADGNHIHRELPGKIYRDSQGRMRRETTMEVGVTGFRLESVTINDPTQQVFISLDTQLKTASIHHFHRVDPAPADRAVPKPAPQTPIMRPAAKPEALGTREFEGFTATGVRSSRVMEAGRIGNEKPIISVYESWYSKDLRTELLAITDDPQSGRRTTRLTNIQTGEPDPLLFQVPPDYTVKED